MKNKSKIIILFSIFYFLFSSTSTLAAQLNLTSQIQEIGVGQEFQIDLMLDAENQDINAAEGKIIFPENLLEIKEIYTGNSIINFWIEQPVINNNEIIFSGVIPGGFSGVLSPYYKGGKPGKILSLIVKTKNEGYGSVEIKDAKVLLNDGSGTQASLVISNFRFLSLREMSHRDIISNQIQKDTNLPELFTPEIARDPDVFDGKWFLVFSAEDKGLGIDHYEVAEKRGTPTQNYAELPWQKAESPHLLSDQKLKSYIYVKAVDKAGSFRVVYLPPALPWYKKWLVHIAVGAGVIIMVLLGKWLQKRFLRKKYSQ